MFNKLNFKTLLIIFGSLLVLVILTQLFKIHGNDRNFNSQLFTIDTAKISSIFIKPKNRTEEIKIFRTGTDWSIAIKGKNVRTDKNGINSILAELSDIKAERVAATDKSDWSAYQVSDSSTKVRVEQNGKTIADFIVGKFSYQQNPQKFSTFIRINGENETYSVQGFLSMTFGRGINDFRDKTMVNVPSQNITRLTFTYPNDSSYVLTLDNKKWKIGSVETDSAKTANFLNSITRLSGNEIANDNALQGNELYSLKIEGNSMQPIQLVAFESDSINKHLITSSINPDTKFSDTQNELIKKIFTSKKSLLSSKK